MCSAAHAVQAVRAHILRARGIDKVCPQVVALFILMSVLLVLAFVAEKGFARNGSVRAR